MKKILFLLLLLPLTACEALLNDDDECTPNNNAGLKVWVYEPVVGGVLGPGVTVVAKEGNFEEELDYKESKGYFSGVYSREGVYTITVSHESYQTYTSGNITVAKDPCNNIVTEERDVTLQPK